MKYTIDETWGSQLTLADGFRHVMELQQSEKAGANGEA